MDSSDACDGAVPRAVSLGAPFSRRASSSGGAQALGHGEQPCYDSVVAPSERSRSYHSPSFVLTSAWDGWESIHEQPLQAFVCGVLGTLVTIVVNSFILMIASKPVRWSHHAVSAVYTCCHSATLLLVWRYGPKVTNTRTYYVFFCTAVFLQIGVSARLMLGPDNQVPFGNRLTFAMVNALTVWTWIMAAMLGCWAVDHPREPYRSLAPALINSTVRTLRLTDGITDMLVIRLILQQAQEPCFWFGAVRSCVRWRVMAGFAAVFASVDLSLSIFFAMTGSRVEATARSTRLQRVYKYVHVVSFGCEVGILTVTLVKLFSSFREPAAGISEADRRSSITLIAVSFLVTLATFSVTMLGLRRIAAAVTRVRASVRSRFSHASTRTGRPSASGRQRSAAGSHTGADLDL